MQYITLFQPMRSTFQKKKNISTQAAVDTHRAFRNSSRMYPQRIYFTYVLLVGEPNETNLAVVRAGDDQRERRVKAGPVDPPVVSLQHVLHHGVGSPEEVGVDPRDHVVVLLDGRRMG